jgi:glucan biosynthesis protein C
MELGRDAQPSRLWFVDNVRVFLTVLVIAHHAGQPYGTTGGMWLVFNPERANILGAFFATNAAFFMGLFFLISGYFVPGAYARKGAKVFLQERFLRLGVPILFFALLIFPPVFYLAESREESFGQFLLQVYLRQPQMQAGHLWFLMHLLVYAVCYAVWCGVIRQDTKLEADRKQAFPSHKLILLYLILLSVVSFVARIHYPIDTWVDVLGIPTEVAHLPQYLSLFAIGITAYHHDWFRRLPRQQGFVWFGVGLGAVLLRYVYALGGESWFPTRIVASGGWNWRSLLWSFWETTICIGLCIGILALFREYFNRQGKWEKLLSANAYTVYLIHVLPVIALQIGFVPLPISPLLKFFGVTLIGVPLCFLSSHYLRKLPLANTIL